MNFVSAVKSCLVQYVGFSGRATRSEFWWFVLFQMIISIVAGMLKSDVLFNIAFFALLLPNLAVGARRLHDVGHSGWWQLLMLTGIGSLVLLYWYVQPSDDNDEENEYSEE